MKHRDYNPQSDFICSFDGWKNKIEAVNNRTEMVEINVPPVVNGRPVDEIGENAFSGCTKLRWVKLPDSVETIRNSAFKNCTELKEAELSAALESIGAFAFSGCVNLRSVTISDHVKRMEINSFKGCRKLTEIKVKSSVTGEIKSYQVASDNDESIWMFLSAVMRASEPGHESMEKYDAAFLEIQDDDAVYRISVQRLRDPVDLYPDMERVYRSRLRNMVKKIILKDRVDMLTAIGELDCIDMDSLDYYIEIASRIGGGCIAYLLEHQYRKSRIGLRDYSL
ncbi:MAG: leucine-rich repeat domain-containing protein [Anaerovoracaceae bacterium]